MESGGAVPGRMRCDALLSAHSLRTCAPYIYQNMLRRVRVMDVCDGDTLRVAALFGGAGAESEALDAPTTGPFLVRVRLRGINADELRSQNPAARARAMRARDRIVRLCLGDAACPPGPLAPDRVRALLDERPVFVDLEHVGIDKYGRVLADARLATGTGTGTSISISIAAVLMEEGLVSMYSSA